MPSALTVLAALDALERAARERRAGNHPRTTARALACAELEHVGWLKRELEPLVAEQTEELAAALNKQAA